MTPEFDSEASAVTSGGSVATLEARLHRLEAQVTRQQVELAALQASVVGAAREDRLSLIVFSGSLDRLLAAFILATGAAAMGTHTTMFFTFWGTAALRKPTGAVKKAPLERLFGWMLPRGATQLPLSQMNFMGAGPVLIKRVMKQRGVASIDDLITLAAELGVEIFVCSMSMELLGIKESELREFPNLGFCGATTFLEKASPGRMSMFI